MAKDRYFAPPPTPPIRKPTLHAPPPVAQTKPMPGTVAAHRASPPPVPPAHGRAGHAPPPVAQMKPMPGAVAARPAVSAPPKHYHAASAVPGRAAGRQPFSNAIIQRMSIETFKAYTAEIHVNGKRYPYETLRDMASGNPTLPEGYLDRQIGQSHDNRDVEKIIRNITRDYRTKNTWGNFLKAGLPEDDFSQTDSGTVNILSKILTLPAFEGEEGNLDALMPGLNPFRLGFLLSRKLTLEEKGYLAQIGHHYLKVVTTSESFFEGGDPDTRVNYIVVRKGAKARLQKILPYEGPIDEFEASTFYHWLLGLVSGYHFREISQFVKKNQNSNTMLSVKIQWLS